jgi:hypothetical protein
VRAWPVHACVPGCPCGRAWDACAACVLGTAIGLRLTTRSLLRAGSGGDGEQAGEDERADATHAHGVSPSPDAAFPFSACDDALVRALNTIADDAYYESLKAELQHKFHEQRMLPQHVTAFFSASTRTVALQKQRDWELYCAIVLPPARSLPAPHDVPWPPPRDVWLDFLVGARKRVRSYERLRMVMCHVCSCAVAFHARERGVPPLSIDPRSIYTAETRRALTRIRRQYGLGVVQVEGITHQEVMSVSNFVDPCCLRDVIAAAAFYMGAHLGGRRPRTLTSLRVKDTLWVAPVLAPQLNPGELAKWRNILPSLATGFLPLATVVAMANLLAKPWRSFVDPFWHALAARGRPDVAQTCQFVFFCK